MENQEMLTKIRSAIICLNSHPDCEPESEFQDRLNDLLQVEFALKSRLCDVTVNHRNQIVKTMMDTIQLLKKKVSALEKEAIESTELISSNIDENLKQFKTIQELSETNLALQKTISKMKQSSTVDAFITFENGLNTDELMAENRSLKEEVKDLEEIIADQDTKILNQKNEIKRLCKQLRNMPK